MYNKMCGLSCLILSIVVLVSCASGTPATVTATPGVPTAQPANPAATVVAKATTVPSAPTSTPKPSGATATPYYQGKTIEIMVDSTAGGGTDTIARLTAAYLPKYIPGTPKIIIRNFAGAGGVIANNSFTEKARPDGLYLIQNATSPLFMQLGKRDMIKYDLTKYRHVGNVARAESVILVRKGLIGRLTDSKAQPLVVGTREGGETWQAIPMWGKEFLGWNLRWIAGFGGTSEMELSFRRGELDMIGTSNAYVIRRFQEEGIADMLATVGSLKGDKFTGRPDFPEVPTFDSMLGAKKPTGVPWQAYIAWMGPNLVDKSLAAPQRTPDNVMSILTDSFAKMSKDAQFNDMVKKTVTDVYDISVGKETDDLVKLVLSTSPEALAYAQDLQRKFGIAAQ